MPIQMVTDAKDLWDAVRCLRGYSGNDQSLSLLIATLQEAIELGEIDLWCWCATTDFRRFPCARSRRHEDEDRGLDRHDHEDGGDS